MAAGAETRLACSHRGGAGNTPGGDRSHLRSTKGVCATSHSRRAEVRGGPVGLVLSAPPRPCTLRRYGLPGRREPAWMTRREFFFIIVFRIVTARRRACERGN